jgi:ABC-type transporter Mla MlaB component
VGLSSFFGKKDRPGDKKGNGKPDARRGPAQPAATGPAGRPAVDVQAARDAARATAMKIDQIEAEMSRSFTRRDQLPGALPLPPPPAPVARISPELAKAAANQRASDWNKPSKLGRPSRAGSQAGGSGGVATDIMLGSSSDMNALELAPSDVAPVIEEAAVTYADGRAAVAAQNLETAIRGDELGASALMAWQMLFDLYQIMGKREEFEDLALDYASLFEASPPAYVDESPAARNPQLATGGNAFIAFSGALDQGIVPQLEKLRRMAEKNDVIRLDFSKVTGVDAVGAELLLRVLNAFHGSTQELLVTGADHIVHLLREAIEVGRRDPSDAIWMLTLEMYRLLEKEHEFEELSIDYCVTYEVSPPAWQPASRNVRAAQEADQAGPGDTIPTAGDGEMVKFEGEIEGKAEFQLDKFRKFAANHRVVVVDCSKLKRIDFAAAGNLLNLLFGLNGQDKQVVFRHVNHMVAALFMVMGIQDMAVIERRRL